MNDSIVRWLCHDLATPVATILTASELLGPGEDQEIRDMVTDAAKRLAARLRLIRMALAPSTAEVGGPMLARLVGEGTGTHATWNGGTDGVGPATAAAIAGVVLGIAAIGVELSADEIILAGRPAPEKLVAAFAGNGAADDNHSALALAVAARALGAGLHLAVISGTDSTRVRILGIG